MIMDSLMSTASLRLNLAQLSVRQERECASYWITTHPAIPHHTRKDAFQIARVVRVAEIPKDALIRKEDSVLQAETFGMAGIKVAQSIAHRRKSIAMFPASELMGIFCPWVSLVCPEVEPAIAPRGKTPSLATRLQEAALTRSAFHAQATAHKHVAQGRSLVRSSRISTPMAAY
eukprot:TRINITY_DN103797_c0_g1_i1.p2 TRINITY_DN103797_c0_g1~~TRINITY_DN103797_c0_g1_i1.p2  ORF type:complete len:174 (+),score=17.33 TRINITY_DN103797_c0_g1_i1:101-622(+)